MSSFCTCLLMTHTLEFHKRILSIAYFNKVNYINITYSNEAGIDTSSDSLYVTIGLKYYSSC